MRVVSVNVGLPRTLEWHGKTVSTGIFKQPVPGPVEVRRLNLDGDRQADLSVHGGPDKAVYGYPAEHYPFWRAALPGTDLAWAGFGENLTTEGLLETSLQIGDRIRAGSAELTVTQPRMPCYKLGIRFDRADMVGRFLAEERSGFYFRVEREGVVQADDAVELIARDRHGVTVADLVRTFVRDRDDLELMRRALRIEVLPPFWRTFFEERLAERG